MTLTHCIAVLQALLLRVCEAKRLFLVHESCHHISQLVQLDRCRLILAQLIGSLVRS